MTNPWLPLPIPMLPANEGYPSPKSFGQLTVYDEGFDLDEDSIRSMMLFAEGRAKAEREALEMMERAKAMMREPQ